MAITKSGLREKAFERARADAKAGRRAFLWEEFCSFMYGSEEWNVYCETYASQFPAPRTWAEKQKELRQGESEIQPEVAKHYEN